MNTRAALVGEGGQAARTVSDLGIDLLRLKGLKDLSGISAEVVFLSLEVLGKDAAAALTDLKERHPTLPCIVLAETDPQGEAVLAQGADDYLLLSEADSETVRRSIRQAAARRELLKKLENSSYPDPVTGLYNRRGFLDHAAFQAGVSTREHRRAFLICAGLDNLEAIRREHGREAGDRALRAVSEALRGTFREVDVLGRLDMDCFAVFGLEEGVTEYGRVLERIGQRVADFNANSGEPFSLTVTTGLSYCPAGSCVPISQLLTQAELIMREKRAATA